MVIEGNKLYLTNTLCRMRAADDYADAHTHAHTHTLPVAVRRRSTSEPVGVRSVSELLRRRRTGGGVDDAVVVTPLVLSTAACFLSDVRSGRGGTAGAAAVVAVEPSGGKHRDKILYWMR